MGASLRLSKRLQAKFVGRQDRSLKRPVSVSGLFPDSICLQATVHGFAPGFFHICAQATALCIGFKPRANKKYDITERLSSFGKADVAYAECRTLFQRLPHCVGNHYSGQPAVTQIEPHHHTDKR